MSRSTWFAGGLAACFAAAALWLYVDRRALEDRLAAATAAATVADPWAAGARSGGAVDRGDLDALARGLGGDLDRGNRPEIVDQPKESRLDRRLRRQAEIASLVGREPGETDDEYRARVMPLVEAMLSRPRDTAGYLRRQAEGRAGVTPEQRAQIDSAFNAAYDELLTYTNAAVADRQLDPYERNVSGMLEYAGGLGQILQGAETQVGGILSPEQQRIIYDSGFEWGEYLGVSAPWEQLAPPPPPPGGPGGS